MLVFTCYIAVELLKVKVLVAQSCPTLCNPMGCSPPGSSVYRNHQARILQWLAISFSIGIFPTQGLTLGLLHCRQILYHLSHQGSNIVVKSYSQHWHRMKQKYMVVILLEAIKHYYEPRIYIVTLLI